MKILLLLVSIIATTLATKLTSDSTQKAVSEVQAATEVEERSIIDPFLLMAKEPKGPIDNAVTQLKSFVYRDENHAGKHIYEMEDGILIVLIITIVILLLLLTIICCCCCSCCVMEGGEA